MKTRAFTLIELLVVVLIIGILAAIAVPQYQKAVAKAELSQLVFIVKSIRRAQDVYFLNNGTYTTNLNDLDISITDGDIKCHAFAKYASCYNKRFSLLAYYNINSQVECAAKTDDETNYLATICKDFTGASQGSVANYQGCEDLNKRPCVIFANKMPL